MLLAGDQVFKHMRLWGTVQVQTVRNHIYKLVKKKSKTELRIPYSSTQDFAVVSLRRVAEAGNIFWWKTKTYTLGDSESLVQGNILLSPKCRAAAGSGSCKSTALAAVKNLERCPRRWRQGEKKTVHGSYASSSSASFGSQYVSLKSFQLTLASGNKLRYN